MNGNKTSPSKIARDLVERLCRDPEKRPYRDHLFRTFHWVTRLAPPAGEALLTAALLHDIERVLKRPDPARFDDSKTFTDKNYLSWHQRRSAESAAKLLKERGLDKAFIMKVHALILHHEEGGTDEQNLLKDADSLSFLEVSAGDFIQEWVPVAGKEKVKAKFDWMFGRISSAKARELTRPFYESALKRLEEAKIQHLGRKSLSL